MEQGSAYDMQMMAAPFQAGSGQDLTFTAFDPNYPATDEGIAKMNLPFDFTYFGRKYRSFAVSVNGYVTFSSFVPTSPNGDTAHPIPSGSTRPAALIPALSSDLLLDDMTMTRPSRITQEVTGSAP